MVFNKTKLKNELLRKIDQTNQLELEKVERYMNLVDLYYKLDKYIRDEKVITVVKNGTQEYIKANPAIAEKNKINAQLLAIEKAFEFENDTGPDTSGSDLV